jgi:hypothetical protein
MIREACLWLGLLTIAALAWFILRSLPQDDDLLDREDQQ